MQTNRMQVFELFQVPLLMNIVHATAAVLKKNKQKRLFSTPTYPEQDLGKWNEAKNCTQKSLYLFDECAFAL